MLMNTPFFSFVSANATTDQVITAVASTSIFFALVQFGSYIIIQSIYGAYDDMPSDKKSKTNSNNTNENVRGNDPAIVEKHACEEKKSKPQEDITPGAIVYANRVMSLVHGSIAAIFSVHSAMESGVLPENLGARSTDSQVTLFAVSLGYFIIDSISLFAFPKIEPNILPYIAHHIGAIIGLGYGVHSGKSGAELVAAMACLEITNPLVHIMWFFRFAPLLANNNCRSSNSSNNNNNKKNKNKNKNNNNNNNESKNGDDKNGLGYTINKKGDVPVPMRWLFAVVFITARGLVGPVLTWKVLSSDAVDGYLKASAGSLQAISMVWLLLVFKKIIPKTKTEKKKEA